MAKTPQLSRKRPTQSKVEQFKVPPNRVERLRHYDECMTEKKAENLANNLMDWSVEEKKALFLHQFLAKEEIPESTWWKYERKYECLALAANFAKTQFANRREQLAIVSDNKFVSGSIHLYSKLFEDDKTLEFERKKELKNIESESKTKNIENMKEVFQDFMGPITEEQKEQHEQRIRSKTKDNV